MNYRQSNITESPIVTGQIAQPRSFDYAEQPILIMPNTVANYRSTGTPMPRSRANA
jgi:hypothetical protein